MNGLFIQASESGLFRGFALWTALGSEPRLGTTEGTVIYSAAGIEVVVDSATGRIVALWWIA